MSGDTIYDSLVDPKTVSTKLLYTSLWGEYVYTRGNGGYKPGFWFTASMLRRDAKERKYIFMAVIETLKNNNDFEEYTTFIETGCYRDCLIIASLAKTHGYSKDLIKIILTPMAFALLDDENEIVKRQLYGSKSTNLSTASNWAPRRGKAFAEFITPLKQLCSIYGHASDMKWRKYIQRIVKECSFSTSQ